MDRQSRAYRIPFALDLRGNLDPSRLQRAWRRVVHDNPALRTRIDLSGTEPAQVIDAGVDIELDVIEVPDRDEAATSAIADLLKRPFDLESGPTWTAALIQRNSTRHVLFVEVHHCFFDGRSQDLLLRELADAYQVDDARHSVSKPTYGAFARWQRERLNSGHYERDEAFWLDHLAGDLPSLTLPLDRPRPATQDFSGALVRSRLDREVADGLRTLATREGATVFMALFAAYVAFLSRYTGQNDIIVGSPLSTPEDPRWEQTMGLMVNTLALRTRLSANDTFRTLLNRVRSTWIDAFEHQGLPFENLVAALRPARELDRTPVFQTLFAYRQAENSGLDIAGVQSRCLDLDSASANTDLSVWIEDTGADIDVVTEYATALFDGETVERWLRHLEYLTRTALAWPNRPLRDLPLMSPAELEQVRDVWNATAAPRSGATLIEIVADRATSDGDRVAVASATGQLSYRQLNERAECLAQRLVDQFPPGATVGVCVERSEHLLTCLLGIWRAGCVYLPLDPAFPGQRVGFMLDDAGAAAVICDATTRESLPDRPIPKLVLRELFTTSGSRAELPSVAPDAIAYVIYTSGSTGEPKGVRVAHAALMNLLESMRERPGIVGADVLAAVTTVSFDISLLELWLPAMVGAQCYVVDATTAGDPARLVQTLDRSGATMMQATPATWRMLADYGWTGSSTFRVLSGGEQLPADLARHHAALGAQVWNLYGPTETTIWSSVERVAPTVETVTVGRPIANTQIYIVDDDDRLQPIGVAGEIAIAGAGVAEGYHRRPELTGDRFRPNPFAKGRLYRTGDLGRWRRDGRIEHLGRIDNQIKIRGFRIEPGEIEATLRDLDVVSDAVVGVHRVEVGDDRLLAYVVPAPGQRPSPINLRKTLRESLPNYMIPQQFVMLESLPLTANGKVDHKALPAPGAAPWLNPTRPKSPATATEKALAKLWSDVLGHDNVGVDDNFFDAGGHSLLTMRVIRSVEADYGVRLSPQAFILDTLGQMAAQIDAARDPSGTTT